MANLRWRRNILCVYSTIAPPSGIETIIYNFMCWSMQCKRQKIILENSGVAVCKWKGSCIGNRCRKYFPRKYVFICRRKRQARTWWIGVSPSVECGRPTKHLGAAWWVVSCIKFDIIYPFRCTWALCSGFFACLPLKSLSYCGFQTVCKCVFRTFLVNCWFDFYQILQNNFWRPT